MIFRQGARKKTDSFRYNILLMKRKWLNDVEKMAIPSLIGYYFILCKKHFIPLVLLENRQKSSGKGRVSASQSML
jgi:hypothetical protein